MPGLTHTGAQSGCRALQMDSRRGMTEYQQPCDPLVCNSGQVMHRHRRVRRGCASIRTCSVCAHA
eukprot:14803098-Alexandrium_andersonii.AAC.1